ncbi:MAG: hypothetical protein ACLP6E_05655 [Acidimicrobiales bacterium]
MRADSASGWQAYSESNSRSGPRLEAQVDNAGSEAPRRELHVVRPDTGRTGRAARRAVYVGPVLVLLSLLAVAGAQTYLTEGQVRLTGLQAAVSAAQTKKLDLELQIADEEQPGAVMAAARALGLVTPTKISELPAVSLHEEDAGKPGMGNPSKTKSADPTSGDSSPTSLGTATSNGSTRGTRGAGGTPGAP